MIEYGEQPAGILEQIVRVVDERGGAGKVYFPRIARNAHTIGGLGPVAQDLGEEVERLYETGSLSGAERDELLEALSLVG